MQLAGAQVFDRLAAHAARRPFKYGSRQYAPGEPFDTVALSEREARILYEHRFIVQAEPRTVAPQAPTTPPAALPGPGADGAQAQSQLAAAPSALAREIRHLGGGWYDVIGPDGNPLNDRRLRKQEAEELTK